MPTAHERRPSFGSFPHSQSSSSLANGRARLSPAASFLERTPSSSHSSTQYRSLDGKFETSLSKKPRKLKSQYPRDSSERHVEYILVASFHIDRGPIMEHQYPAAISGDESMLAELMLPDQTHVRSQDWTIFFLHKDTEADEEESQADNKKRKKRRRGAQNDEEDDQKHPVAEHEQDETDDQSSDDDERSEGEGDEDGGGEGPPLMYVLNLVNTKQDNTVRRGAVVKAMAICTRHSFLHIYKPILLLALEEYFKAPYTETLANLYDSLNDMDLSLMPRFSYLERSILQASDSKDMFVEKFEHMIQQRQLEETNAANDSGSSPGSPTRRRYAAPRDTHEFESKIMYNDIPVPVKVPTAIWPETVGDFSLVKLIQTFSMPHSTSPQPFTVHPHLTSNGVYTHPIIVLVNAMLTQKRVVFLGHNRPSGEVAEAVLAACALASGGILRGFTRHAFPYTDLTKIDDLLKVPGFIAGVTNPTFANHPEWWDLLCDLPTGRMKISSHIEAAPITEGLVYFQHQNGNMPGPAVSGNHHHHNHSDLTGDIAFMEDVLRSVAQRHGENAIRTKWRSYIQRFTRIAASFEETVYGASALYVIGPTEIPPASPDGAKDPTDLRSLRGHGYVWPDEASKTRELAAWVSRIEGWRNTRSYYAFVQDVAAFYHATGPVKSVDLQHHHDRLRAFKLSQEDSAAIYLAFSHAVKDYTAICQLLTVMPESQAGLFYLSLGLFHSDLAVREATVELLDRVAGHEAGRHFWNHLGRFTKLAYFRVRREREAALSPSSPDLGPGSSSGNNMLSGAAGAGAILASQPSHHSLVGVALGDGPSNRRS